MIDIYILDENRNQINIIDNYESLIWAKRYNDIGDCEIKISASIENLNKFRNGVYLSRQDDDLVCRIEKIELDTDVENGNYIIVTGYDIKKILGQRIIWKQTNFNGLVEDYLRKLIDDNIINPSLFNRKIDGFVLDEKSGFDEKIREQVSYDNLNEKIQETIKKYNWGYKVYLNENKNFVFKLYKGRDKSKYVIFSNDYENLSSTKYSEDKTNIKNVVLTAGEGEGADRITNTTGSASGINRYELYVDARNISKKIDYNDLITSYSSGKEVVINGITYWQVDGTNIAIITRENENKVEVTLTDTIYQASLSSKGLEELANYQSTKSFEGIVEPRLTFQYKKDYDLGDIVSVSNEYEIEVEARIIEIIEVYNDNGYSVEPKFEYLVDDEIPSISGYILNENETKLKTENNEFLILEEFIQPITAKINNNELDVIANEIRDLKISELPNADTLNNESCIPVVAFGETRKITYEKLKEILNEAIGNNFELTIASTITGDAGTNANVKNIGSNSKPVLEFTIPKGEKGDNGVQGPMGPEGQQGLQGEQGPRGDNGTSAYVYFRYSPNENGNPMTIKPDSTTQYLGVISTSSTTAPTSSSSYTWVKIHNTNELEFEPINEWEEKGEYGNLKQNGKYVYPYPYYPVGAIVLFGNNTNPNDIYIGKWEQLKDVFVLACGDKYKCGDTGGEEKVTLTIDTMPSHQHKAEEDKTHGEGAVYGKSSQGADTECWGTSRGSYKYLKEINTSSVGGNQPHNNMPPYVAKYCWERVA